MQLHLIGVGAPAFITAINMHKKRIMLQTNLLSTLINFRDNALLFFACLLLVCCQSVKKAESSTTIISNPIVPGYYADPSIVKDGDTYFIYATIDPWGAEELAVLETKDFKHFEKRNLNWPTKAACTSASSNNSMVWAPSVVKAPDGKFYMYVSVGSEIWAGVSETPLGPWKNMKQDSTPLIAAADFKEVHNIDADCYIDEDGQAYLYWGSGFNWVNGHCMAVKLNKDMMSFNGMPQEVTPPGYFEGPHMIKRNGRYYLMFSEGKAIDATYRVGYAVGETPFGPFTKGINSPILTTSQDSSTYGPGHHTVFREKEQDYILYHRILPQKEAYVLRQLCIDSLNYDEKGNLLAVKPTGVSNFTEN